MNVIHSLRVKNIPHSVVCAVFYIEGYGDFKTYDWFVIVPKIYKEQIKDIPGFHSIHHKKVFEKTFMHYELKYFFDNISEYNEVLSDKTGRVFEPKNPSMLITCSKRFNNDNKL